MRPNVIFFLVVCSLGISGARPRAEAGEPGLHREVRYVMGTLLDIALFHRNDQGARKVLTEAFLLAARLDGLLSNYKPESEVSRLNEKAGRGRVRVSRELYEFLRLAKSLSERTEGAFDVTVGPLVELWKKTGEKPPSLEQVRAAKNLTGSRHLVLYPSQKVELMNEGSRIETGGLGKGYAADRIARLLIQGGVESALINFGHSSIRAIGSPPGQTGWNLVLEFPNDAPLGVLELNDQALSASYTLGKVAKIGESRFGHIIDPESGKPTTEKVQAVVLGPSAAEAEALSKYIILRGWKARENLQAWGPVQILRRAGNREMKRSEGFPLN